MTYARLGSVLLAAAFTTSIAHQAYRAVVAEAPVVDDLRPWVLIAYATAMLLVWAVAADVRAAWWVTVLGIPVNLGYGALVLYPAIHRARSLDVVDWVEAMVYSGLLTTVLVIAVLRLRETPLHPAPGNLATG